MYFSYDKSSLANLYPLYAEDVWDIIKMNRRGEKPESLKNDDVPAAPEFVTAVGDDAINRFDEARKRKKKKKKQQPKQDSQKGEKKDAGERHGGNRGGRNNRGRRNNDRPKKETPKE